MTENHRKGYHHYIASSSWGEKRDARRKLDGNRCRLCDATAEEARLEVHHRPSAYAKIPNESVEDDLVTLCVDCHDFVTDKVRRGRYADEVPLPPKAEVRKAPGPGPDRPAPTGPAVRGETHSPSWKAPEPKHPDAPPSPRPEEPHRNHIRRTDAEDAERPADGDGPLGDA
ncbi:HNH endonuclease [Gemmatimonadota bacterium]